MKLVQSCYSLTLNRVRQLSENATTRPASRALLCEPAAPKAELQPLPQEILPQAERPRLEAFLSQYRAQIGNRMFYAAQAAEYCILAGWTGQHATVTAALGKLREEGKVREVQRVGHEIIWQFQ